MDVKERIERHLGQLAPHIKARETSKLLTAAVAEIDRLRRAITELHAHKVKNGDAQRLR